MLTSITIIFFDFSSITTYPDTDIHHIFAFSHSHINQNDHIKKTHIYMYYSPFAFHGPVTQITVLFRVFIYRKLFFSLFILRISLQLQTYIYI